MKRTIKIQASKPFEFEVEEEELSNIELDYEKRSRFRSKKLTTIKQEMHEELGDKVRVEQGFILFFLNLLIPLTLSGLNAYVLLALGKKSELKGYLITGFVGFGAIVAIGSSLHLAGWKQTVKLYFMLDALIPNIISGIIGFFAVFNFLSTNEWYEIAFTVCFPFWVFYYAGSIRVMLAYLSWPKWRVITFKIGVLLSGLIFFYVGVDYMNGSYKVSKGFLPAFDQKVKNLVLLYVFGNCDLFFSYYRRLSSFDQTEELKAVYQFESHELSENKALIEEQIEIIEQEQIENEIRQSEAAQNKANQVNMPKNQTKNESGVMEQKIELSSLSVQELIVKVQ